MSTLSQFLGGGVTTAIVNAHSSGGTSATLLGATVENGAREVLSGALTANTLSTLLTITGSGRVPLLSAYTKDATSRTVRLVVDVDGVTVFDATSSAVASGSTPGIFAAGFRDSGGSFFAAEPIVFSSSLVVKVASSLSETAKVAIAYSCVRT